MENINELLAGLKPLEGKELENFKMEVNKNKKKQAKKLEACFHKGQIDDDEIYNILSTYAGDKNIWQLFADFVENANLTDKAFNIGLKAAWTEGTGTGDYRVFVYFEKADKKLIMNEEESAFYDNLPDKVTLYRGCCKDEVEDEDSILGVSWTTEREIAEFFAFRFKQNNTAVYSVDVLKEDIKAIFLDRSEFEAIYLYCDQSEALLVTDEPTDYYKTYMKRKIESNSIYNYQQ